MQIDSEISSTDRTEYSAQIEFQLFSKSSTDCTMDRGVKVAHEMTIFAPIRE